MIHRRPHNENLKSISVYKNGHLILTAPTSGLPKYVKGDLHVNKLGGYDGSIASIRYFPKTLSQQAIKYIYKVLKITEKRI